jgi:sugar diacid utilization regulator
VTELQRIVDSLARVTRLAVSVHDRNRRLLAFSSHDSSVDDVRKESILTRRGPARGFDWARSFGIESADGPVRVPANSEIGMAARICAPARLDDRLLGYLWLADPDETLADTHMDLIKSTANSVALAIHHLELAEEIDRGRERELLRDLLSEQEDVRRHATDELLAGELLVPGALTVVLVARPMNGREAMTAKDTKIRTRLERALARARGRAAPRQALHLVRPDHGVLLMTCGAHEKKHIDDVATELHGFLSESLAADNGWKAVVGIGDNQDDLAAAHVSYGQARKAAEVCGVLNPAGPVLRWAELGVYRTLLQLPLSDVNVRDLHPGLGSLFASKDASVWLKTLECYLDLGCDARTAARTLHINRSSLYHRVHRIEQIASVDLSKGDDRLALHLGLKLARLSGLLTPSS